MVQTEQFEGKIQTTGDFTEMKEVDVEAPRATVDLGACDAPAPAVPIRSSCRKKCLIAAGVLLVVLLLTGLLIGAVTGDGDDDDQDDRNKMCERMNHRPGRGRGGPKGDEGEPREREGEAQHRGKRGGDDGDDSDDHDAKKFCMRGGKICGSSLMLTNKETQEEQTMTVYADEGGVLEVAESLKKKYDVSEPTPLSCAKPKGRKGKKGGKGRRHH